MKLQLPYVTWTLDQDPRGQDRYSHLAGDWGVICDQEPGLKWRVGVWAVAGKKHLRAQSWCHETAEDAQSIALYLLMGILAARDSYVGPAPAVVSRFEHILTEDDHEA